MWEYHVVNMIKSHDIVNFPQRGWVYDECLNAYIRATSRNLPIGTSKTIDVASVEVSDKKKGHFKRFLERIEELAREHGRVVYIENVLDDWFVTFFKKRGYKEIKGLVLTCLYRE